MACTCRGVHRRCEGAPRGLCCRDGARWHAVLPSIFSPPGCTLAPAQVDNLYATYNFSELPQLLPHYPHFYHKQVRAGCLR